MLKNKRGTDWTVRKNGIVLEEKVIWNIFECLARACIMLENGSESLDAGNGQDWIPVCHLDLKPANILIGNKDDRHDDIGIFKMGDFGLSAHVPHNSKDPRWLKHVTSQLTLGWGTPEQFFPQMKNRSYSTPANIFGVAAIVYYLMTKQQVKIGQGMAYVGFPSLDSDNNIMPQVPVLTCGRDLLDNPMIKNSGIYSKSLIRTLLQCLAYYPNERMTARQLLDICIKGRFLFGNMLEEYTYEDSQPATNHWPERTATSTGIPRNEDLKEHLKYYPTRELIAAEEEREERFLASFWVTPTRQIAPSASVFVNPFGSAGDLSFNSGTSAPPFSFGHQPSSSQFNNSNLF
ncbi:hypothetical protein OCU04_012023 [Sclerotinia nivalis]|uniref:Protein kinase domain-containing protein n=1 Tax=Sclerotinia nivalis TaxID=352851 RepID=A0A9X0DFQ1_9HELO|nr:hypothetical protein OCU04_012023 [Sclerotinia nivalis]